MKLIHRDKVKSFNLKPTDTLRLEYHRLDGDTQLLGEYAINKETTVDVVGVVELEGKELDALELEEGLAGFFGKEKI